MTKGVNVYFFSGSGHSKAVASWLEEKLGPKPAEIDNELAKERVNDYISIIVFPVYSQNIPSLVKKFLRNVESEYVVIIATYGKKSAGNVLYEASRLLSSPLIAAAAVPMGHTFLLEDCAFDKEPLLPLLERIERPQAISLPRKAKNVFASFFPNARSRFLTRVILDETKCVNCNICSKSCLNHAITNGKTNLKCIRCIKCLHICPQKALHLKTSPLLRNYLKKRNGNETEIYL